MRVSEVVEPFRELVKNPSLGDFVDTGLTDLAREKHNKHDINETDTQRLVRILAHTLNRCFVEKAWLFGSFEGVRKKSFSMDYEGSFRVHHGPSPFTRCLDYAGSESFSSEGSFLVNPESGRALSLLPLMFWDRCDAHPDLDLGHLFLFDRVERKDTTYSYKATGASCCRDVTQQGRYSGLWRQLQPLRESDNHTSMTVGSFIEADERN